MAADFAGSVGWAKGGGSVVFVSLGRGSVVCSPLPASGHLPPQAGEGLVSSLTVGSVVLSLAARRAALRAAARAFAASMVAVLSAETVVVPLGGVCF